MPAIGNIHSIVGQRWPRGATAAIPVFDESTIEISEGQVTNLPSDLAAISARLAALEATSAELSDHYYEPVANGDAGSPEIIFVDGDVVMVRVTD